MLANFIYSVDCVMPLFIVLSIGFFLRQIGLIDHNAVMKMNAVVFNAALPVMLFRDISQSEFMSFFDLSLIVFCVVSTLIIFAILWAMSLIFFKERRSAGSFIQGAFRGNYAIIALPLISNILGRPSGKAVLVAAFTIPLYNVLSVIALSYGASAKNGNSKAVVMGALKNIIRNPIIIGVILGIPFSVFKISFPRFVQSSINYMANLTTPMALLAIGATLTFNNLKRGFKKAALASAMKLIVMPFIFTTAALYTGHTGEALVVLFAMYAAPTATSSYIMADIMKCDAELAANIVICTTVFSIFTFTVGIYIIRSLGII